MLSFVVATATTMKEYNASYLALVHKSFQGDIQLSGPLTLMSCAVVAVGSTNHSLVESDYRVSLYLWKYVHA